jgi:serine/threonine protein kinase
MSLQVQLFSPNREETGMEAALFMVDDATPLPGPDPGELLARALQTPRVTGSAERWVPPEPEELAELLPQYRIEGLLGRGGMGAVYKGVQLALDRPIALKLLPLEISADPAFAERFAREARTLARLNHPHIVGVYDFGTTREGHLYFTMEYVDCATLHELIRGPGGVAPANVLHFAIQVCEALTYAHGEGVIHRDIKPANVLIDRRGRVKVADFGLARLADAAQRDSWSTTMTGTVMGTPAYMAPEQQRGLHVDHRADIYSLGVMLYEMLCGEVPQGHFELPSVRCGVDRKLDAIVTRALSQQPEKRYSSPRNAPPPRDPMRVGRASRLSIPASRRNRPRPASLRRRTRPQRPKCRAGRAPRPAGRPSYPDPRLRRIRRRFRAHGSSQRPPASRRPPTRWSFRGRNTNTSPRPFPGSKQMRKQKRWAGISPPSPARRSPPT